MPKENPLRVIGSTSSLGSASAEELVIQSPCNGCKNFAVGPSDLQPGQTPCPRRIWIAREQEQNGSVPGYLHESGDPKDASRLVNPVRSKSGNLLIWVAAVADNRGVVDSEGNQLTPHILHPDFDTAYIVCRSLPYLPAERQASLFQNGISFDETTPLRDRMFHAFSMKTYTLDNSRNRDPRFPVDKTPIATGGFVRRITSPFGWTLKTPEQDRIASGF